MGQPSRAKTTFIAVATSIMVGTGSVLAQTDPSPLPDPADGTAAARFAVAPVRAADSTLTLITAERDCGLTYERPWSAVHVAETATDIIIRLDVQRLPDGGACDSDQQIRVPVELEAPVGERTIRDGGPSDVPPVRINRVDAIDTGYRYHCGGPAARVVDLLGPGHAIGDDGPVSTIGDARAIIADGDYVEFLGPFGKNGRAQVEGWGLRGNAWERWGWGTCLPMVELEPGRFGATWKLRGRRPGPKSRRIKIWVQGRPCHGSPPPARQIIRPIVQVHPDSIVVIMGTFFPNQLPSEVRDLGSQGGYTFVDCNGFGPSPYSVKLPVALGRRVLFDGGVFPPAVRGTRR